MDASQWLDLQTVLVCLLVFLTIWFYRSITGMPDGFPPGPRPLPIIGNSMFMKRRYGEEMTKLYQRYGPIVGLNLGSFHAVVLSGKDIIKEGYLHSFIQDKPHFMYAMNKCSTRGGQIRGIAWTVGHIWQKSRMFAKSGLRDFGVGRKSIEGKIQAEADVLYNELLKRCGEPFDFEILSKQCPSNVICNVLFGTRFDFTDPDFINIIKDTKATIESPLFSSPLNFIPLLQYFPKPNWYKKMMSNIDLNYEWLENQINKHRETFDPEHVRDFVDLYLVNESSTDNEVFCPDQLRRIILDMFIGGTDSTANSLRWLVLRMILFPELQRRCQKEVDLVVGSRNPELSNRPNMPFTEALIHENFRYNVGRRLIPPHAAQDDIMFHGYKIPKGTVVFYNVYSVHMDPTYWHQPELFNPDRWIGADGKFHKSDALFVFGAGPRACPGEPLARSELFLFLTSILQKFNLKMADPANPTTMEARKTGILYAPQNFQLVVEPR